jgi:hypothetical protein
MGRQMTKKWTLDDVFVLMERERPPLPARRWRGRGTNRHGDGSRGSH